MRVRTFSEGLAEVRSREAVSRMTASPSIAVDTKGFALLRTPVEEGRRKSFRVFRPSLITEVEQQWIERQGAIGRWTVKVRGTGLRAGAAAFEPFEDRDGDAWKRARSASRRMGERFQVGGGVAQVYDDAGRELRRRPGVPAGLGRAAGAGRSIARSCQHRRGTVPVGPHPRSHRPAEPSATGGVACRVRQPRA